MPVTLIYGHREPEVAHAVAEGDDLWLPLDDLRRSTGWELRPEGVCQDDVCVPILAGREGEFLRRDGGRFNLTALARLLGQPVIHDEAHSVWLFGEAAAERRSRLLSLEAPDFTLPDLEGRPHSLSNCRGKKVFLVSWASW